MGPRLVAILALPGVQLLDVAGPLDVFAEANVQSSQSFYELAIVGTELGHVTTSSGRSLVADLFAPMRSLRFSIPSSSRAPPDTGPDGRD